MMKVFLSVLGSDSEKTIDIPSGKTTLGRGPFLGCSDKKVSRNHAVLEVQSNGDIFLTPTHVNPCFYRTTSETTLRIIKKDIPQRLQPGDVFSLLPNSFQYEVHQKSPDGKVLPLPSETPNKGKSGAPNSPNEEPLNTKSESNHSKKLTENGDSADKTNMQTKSAAPKTEAGKKEEIVKNSENENKKSESTKSSLPKSSTSEKSSLQKSSETSSVANNQILNSCGGKSPKASQLSCPRRRTLPDWLLRSASTAAKAAKSSKNGHSIANNAKGDKKALTNVKIAKVPPTTVSNNNRVNNTGRSYTGRQNRQTIQKISLDDFEVSDDEEAQWKSPDESDDSSQRSKSRRSGRWHGRDSDSGSDWEMENRKSKKNWRSNEASSGSDWETTRTTSSQRKKRGRPQRKSYNSDSGSDWEKGSSKRRSIRKKAAPVTRRPRRSAKRKASEDDDVDEDEDVRNESEDDRKKPRKRKSRKDEKEEEEDVEDEKSTKSSPARSEGGRKREPCLYAKKCYRKNASHFDVYSHPGDSDYASPKEEEEEEDDEDDEEDEAEKKTGSEKKESKKESPQKECPYGIDCFRKNPQHKKEFKHTKKVRPTREASKKSSKYNEEEEEEDISMEESDEYDPAKEIAD